MTNPKIIFRRGAKTDLPNLVSGEIGVTTDTGEIVIGTDGRYGNEIGNRQTFPYRNIRILNEQNRDIFNDMANALERTGNPHAYFDATLFPNTFDYAPVMVSGEEFGIEVGNNASIFLDYSIVDNSGQLVRKGRSKIVMAGDEVSLSDESTRTRTKAKANDQLGDSRQVFDLIDIDYVKIDNELVFRYRNVSPHHHLMRFRLSIPRDIGYITEINSQIDVRANLVGEYNPSPIRDRLWKIGGTDPMGIMDSFGSSSNAIVVPQASYQTADNLYMALRLYDESPDDLNLSLDGSATSGDNRFLSNGPDENMTDLTSRTVLCRFSNTGELQWGREILGGDSTKITEITASGTTIRCTVRYANQTSDQNGTVTTYHGGVLVFLPSGNSIARTYELNEDLVQSFQDGSDTILVMRNSIKRKNSQGTDIWSFNLSGVQSGVPHHISWMAARLVGQHLYLMGLIDDTQETVLVKINAQTGNTIWHRTITPDIDFHQDDLLYPVGVGDQNGNFYVTRYLNDHLYIVKFDADGSVVWGRTHHYVSLPHSYRIALLDDQLVIAVPCGDIIITLLDVDTGMVDQNIVYTDVGDIRKVMGLLTNGGITISMISSSSLDQRMNYAGVVRLPLDMLTDTQHRNHHMGKAFGPLDRNGTPRYQIGLDVASATITPYDGLTSKNITRVNESFETPNDLVITTRNDNFPIIPTAFTRETRTTTQGDYWTGYIRGLQAESMRDTLVVRAVRVRDNVILVAVNCQEYQTNNRYIVLYRLSLDGVMLSRTRVSTSQPADITGMVSNSTGITILTSNLDKIEFNATGSLVSSTRKFSNLISWSTPRSIDNDMLVLADEELASETLMTISGNVITNRWKLQDHDPARSNSLVRSADIAYRNGLIYVSVISGTGGDSAQNIVCLNTVGEIQWSKRLGGISIVKIAPDGLGNLYLLGNSNIVMKLDSLGNKLWSRDYTLGEYHADTQAVDLIIDSNNRIFVILRNTFTNAGPQDGRTFLELSQSGAVLWGRSILPHRGDDFSTLYYSIIDDGIVEVMNRSNDIAISRFPIGAGTEIDDGGERQWIVPQIVTSDNNEAVISTGTISVVGTSAITIGSNVTIGGLTNDVRNNISINPLD